MIEFSKYKAMTFDCYGTLIDWEKPIAAKIRTVIIEKYPEISNDVILLLFANYQAKYQSCREFLNYRVVLSRAYIDVLVGFGLEPTPDDAKAFANSVGEWNPFPDTVSSLGYFQNHFELGILSNVDNASMKQTLAQLETSFKLTVTAEDIGSYKPAFPHFVQSIKFFKSRGISIDEILHVAQSKRHDHETAAKLGIDSVWVNRQHARSGVGLVLPAQAEPALTVNSLSELVKIHKTKGRKQC